MKKKTSRNITDAEWEIMSVVWKKSPITATEVVDALAPRRKWSLATVRTMLRRLVNKQTLGQRLEGKRYLYWPRETMEDCAKTEGGSLMRRLTGAASSVALIHMVKESKLSEDELEELKQILNEKQKGKK